MSHIASESCFRRPQKDRLIIIASSFQRLAMQLSRRKPDNIASGKGQRKSTQLGNNSESGSKEPQTLNGAHPNRCHYAMMKTNIIISNEKRKRCFELTAGSQEHGRYRSSFVRRLLRHLYFISQYWPDSPQSKLDRERYGSGALFSHTATTSKRWDPCTP